MDMNLLILLFLLSEVIVFLIGYKLSSYKYSKLLSSRSFLQEQMWRIEEELRKYNLKIQEQAEKEFSEWLSTRTPTFFESLNGQPELKFSNLHDLETPWQLICNSNNKILSNYLRENEHRNSNKAK
jgi:hypothetical protein